jgi:penicillin-binding protein 1A
VGNARPSRLTGALGFATALVTGSAVIGLVLALVAPVGRILATDTVSFDLPEPELRASAARSTVFDASGNQIAILHSGENRAPVPLREIAPVAVQAVLAAEDRDFYEHNGLDWRGVGRALAANLDAGAVEQGGSTITQQLVKNTLFDDPERDLERKVKEAVLAMGVEQRYTKEQILERYLNTIYLGNGAYGVRAAAERYFATTPSELTLAQGALLAGMIANPEGRDPLENPAGAARARNEVLASMESIGWVNEDDARAARAEPLPTDLQPVAPSPFVDPFVEEVKRQLLRDERLGHTYGERYRLLFEGGLRIHTTLDPRLQAAAELAIRDRLPGDVPYTASLIAIDNRDGAVRAMVPGTDFAHAGFNLATQGARQTGSAFKTMTLAAAIEAGYSPLDRVNASGRCEFGMPDGQDPWRVRNYDSRGMGTVTLTQAIASSSNCAFARVILGLGPERVVDMAKRLGIRSELTPFPSLTLGAQAVSPLDMTSAFSTLATDGIRRPPRFLDRVERADGTLLFEERPDAKQVVDPEVARTVTAMLERVITNGTGRGADLGRPAAGKTGTNQAYRDAWFVGYTPQLTAGVWIGNPEAQVPVVIDGRNVTGGSFPARIWQAFMLAALADVPPEDFVPPDPQRWPSPMVVSEFGRWPAPRSTTAPSRPRDGARPEPRESAPSPPQPTTGGAPDPPAGGGEAPTTIESTAPPPSTIADPDPTTTSPPAGEGDEDDESDDD